MSLAIRASCFVVALMVAGPALAQDRSIAKVGISQRYQSDALARGGYYKYCGADFVCYSGIPLRCASNTRPYQSIAQHQCFCVRDGCPQ
jgi:hypothetical protein